MNIGNTQAAAPTPSPILYVPKGQCEDGLPLQPKLLPAPENTILLASAVSIPATIATTVFGQQPLTTIFPVTFAASNADLRNSIWRSFCPEKSLAEGKEYPNSIVLGFSAAAVSTTVPVNTQSTDSASGSGVNASATPKPIAIGGGAGGSGENPPVVSTGKSGVSSGAIAGAAVGCLIVGIAIGALVMFFLCGRRNKKRASQNAGAYTPVQIGGYAGEKQSAGSSLQLPSESAAAVIERNLGDPASDAELKDEYAKINQKINNHVVSFYTKGEAPVDGAAAQTISNLLGSGSGLGGQQVTALLANPHTRLSLLRYAIARTLISRMDFESAPESSLLPAGAANTIYGMSKVQHNDPVRMAFLTKWRSITAHLLGKSSTASDDSIRRAVLDCNSIVGPYASSGTDQERLRNLEEITRRAGRVAGLLFSQPAFWKFDWQHSGPGLVIFPGLVKVTDESGRLLQPPVVYEEKNVVQIG